MATRATAAMAAPGAARTASGSGMLISSPVFLDLGIWTDKTVPAGVRTLIFLPDLPFGTFTFSTFCDICL